MTDAAILLGSGVRKTADAVRAALRGEQTPRPRRADMAPCDNLVDEMAAHGIFVSDEFAASLLEHPEVVKRGGVGD